MKNLPENLVVLMYASNCCYTSVMDEIVPGLIIDEIEKTWGYCHPKDQFPTVRMHKFGSCNYQMKNRSSGVIGVYDRMDIKQLNAMVFHAREMTDNGRESFDD